MDLTSAVAALAPFRADTALAVRLAEIERAMCGKSRDTCILQNDVHGVSQEAMVAANRLKTALGQIHEIIHALGILLSLPHLLKADERIESLSLGAGNTGKDHDLETTLRIAEFTFITWRGGSEAVRQNKLFRDFYQLAESTSSKERWLYVVDAERPRDFLCNSGRSLKSVLKGHPEILAAVGDQFRTVRDYVTARGSRVQLEDVAPYVRGIADLIDSEESPP